VHRYFSSSSQVGCVSKEYLIPALCKKLGITRAQLPLLCALLGARNLTEKDLSAFHAKLLAEKASSSSSGNNDGDEANKESTSGGFRVLVPAVAEFVSQLKGTVEAVGALLFPLDPKTAEMDPRAVELVNLVQYFKGEDGGKPAARVKTGVTKNKTTPEKKAKEVGDENGASKVGKPVPPWGNKMTMKFMKTFGLNYGHESEDICSTNKRLKTFGFWI
jgi:hypothetical protein